VVNTHYHSDHVNGNKYFKGDKIYIGNYNREFLQKNIEAENQPTDFVNDSLSINIGGEVIHLYNLGQAHTLNDLVVYLENHKVLFTGDLIFNHVNPVLKDESGARVTQWIKVLDIIINRWGNCTIVPGHGKVGGIEMAQSMRKYFVDMTTAAQYPTKEDQIKEKYKDWMKVLNMSSPEKTIKYIKMYETNK
jgi:cyclase